MPPHNCTYPIAGCDIDIAESGSGPRLIILHRDTGRAGWTELHERLAQHFRVVAPSMPGFDASERPDWLRNVPDMAALIARFSQEWTGPDEGFYLGLGFGGWVAAELAVRSPGLVNRLILHSPMGVKPPEGEIFDQFLVEAEDYARLGYASQDVYERARAEEGDNRAARLDRNREMTTRIAWKPAMFDLGLPHLLKGMDVPTLVVWSADDAIVPRSCARAYCDGIRSTRYAQIPGGHMAEHEAPEVLAELVVGFLGVG